MKQNDIQGAVVFFLFGAITTILSLQMPIGSLRAAGSGCFRLVLEYSLWFSHRLS